MLPGLAGEDIDLCAALGSLHVNTEGIIVGLVNVDDHLAQSAVDVANHRVGTHKLGINHVGALLTANLSERHIGHILHWCQHHRAVS